MTNPPLTDKVRELIQKARIVSFTAWQSTYLVPIIQQFQSADDEGRYLTNAELEQVQQSSPSTNSNVSVVQLLRDHASEIVDEARAQVLQAFPDITQPGGGLYPLERAEACWRDFWHFLRCITYGIAGQQTHFTSVEGLGYMQQLYQELQVPLNAMIVGLEGIKAASLKRINPEQQTELAPYFDHLIAQLKQFN